MALSLGVEFDSVNDNSLGPILMESATKWVATLDRLGGLFWLSVTRAFNGRVKKLEDGFALSTKISVEQNGIARPKTHLVNQPKVRGS